MSKKDKDMDLVAHEKECNMFRLGVNRRLTRLEMIVGATAIGIIGGFWWVIQMLLERLPL